MENVKLVFLEYSEDHVICRDELGVRHEIPENVIDMEINALKKLKQKTLVTLKISSDYCNRNGVYY